MCNACEQQVKWVEYVKMMKALELNSPTQQTECRTGVRKRGGLHFCYLLEG